MTDEHQQTGTGWPEPPAGTRPEPDHEPAASRPPDDPGRDDLGPDDLSSEDLDPGDLSPDDLGSVQPERLADPAPAAQSAPAKQPALAAQSAPARQPASAVRRPHFTTAGAVVALLVGLLGFALVVQLRSNAGDQQLNSARPQDLVGILSDLDARKDRLQQEITTLQGTQQQLRAGTQGREAALSAAAKRAADLGILAGTLPAQGPGVRAVFTAGHQGLKSAVVLDAVEELRDAGAEAMQIEGTNGTAVRIVASTSFLDGTGGLQVDGQMLTGPYTIVAIGDPSTMQTALNIPGGVVDTVRNAGGNVIVNQPGSVRVTALHQAGTPKYARPVS